jgi:hypothetical protein
MRPTPREARTLARALAGFDLNGESDGLAEPVGRMVGHLAAIRAADTLTGPAWQEATAAARRPAWKAMLTTFPDSEALIEAVARADPAGPAPAAEVRLTAHVGDLAGANDARRFVWPRWVVRSHFTLLTSEPKVGKTRLGMQLAKILYEGLHWPDGQKPTLPPGTKTLWIPGDRQPDELRELAHSYGLPYEAVLLNARPDEPYGGVSLDDPVNIKALRERILIERPGLVVIDTVWRATRCKLSHADEVNQVMDPIIAIAQECDVAILGMMHASKDGETLGRRLEGLTRAVLKLSKPDPEGQPNRRKLWVERANFLEPNALGVTFHESGCDFDDNPPDAPEPAGIGRPPIKQAQAIAFFTQELMKGDQKQCELISAWEAKGESSSTGFNAMKAMQADGRLIVDDSKKPKMCHLVNKTDGGQEPSS